MTECYRLEGHYAGEPEVYRSRDEVREQWKNDPIPRFSSYLTENEPGLGPGTGRHQRRGPAGDAGRHRVCQSQPAARPGDLVGLYLRLRQHPMTNTRSPTRFGLPRLQSPCHAGRPDGAGRSGRAGQRDDLARSHPRGAARRNAPRPERYFLIGEDIGKHGGAFGVTRTLFDQFGPERVRNTPISENTIIGAATGAALVGLRPVAEIMFIDFSGLAMDQIANQAAKLRLMTGGQCKVPWVLRMPQGGGAGKSTAAQHSQSLEVWYAHIPGLKVVLPATPYDAKGLLKAAIRDDNPVIFLEHKLLYSFKGLVPDGGLRRAVEPVRYQARRAAM